MCFIGVDVHNETHQVCALDEEGRKVWEEAILTTPQGIADLARRLKPLHREGMHIGVEASGPFWIPLAARFQERGFLVSQVNPYCVKQWARAKALLTRSDRVDAALIADYVRVQRPGPFQPMPEPYRTLLDLLRCREKLVHTSTVWKNHLWSLKKREGALPAARINEQLLKALEVQITRVDEEIGEIMARIPLSRVLTGICGVGPVMAAWFLVCYWNLEAFPSKSQAKARLGLIPEEHTSAGEIRRVYMSRRGPTAPRRVLHMATQVALYRKNERVQAVYDHRRAKGDNHRKAMTYAMTALLLQMWKAAKSYRREVISEEASPSAVQ